jgi:hypothetical protein
VSARGHELDATMMTPAAMRDHIIKDFIDTKITEFDARHK